MYEFDCIILTNSICARTKLLCYYQRVISKTVLLLQPLFVAKPQVRIPTTFCTVVTW